MENNIVGLAEVKKVAIALKDLQPNFAFVGGAIASLYINDPAADPARQTMDVDVSFSLKGYAAWARLQEQLLQRGFSPDQESKVICRYRYQGLIVDIMPDDENILGFSNPWYKAGFANKKTVRIDDLTINLFPLPYFIATKFSALSGRGKRFLEI